VLHSVRLCGQETGSYAAPVAETLTWEGSYAYAKNPYDTAYGYYNYHLRTLTYNGMGGMRWTITLPARMQQYLAASIYDKGADKKWSANEIDINDHKEFLTCPELILNDVVAVADITGLLLLDKKNGAVLYDITYPQQEPPRFYIDSGGYTIQCGRRTDSGVLQHGAEFISRCSSRLFHFNGSELFIFDRRNRLIKRIPFDPEVHRGKSEPHNIKATFSGKDYTVEISGRVYFR
jgi:hypothetical protein